MMIMKLQSEKIHKGLCCRHPGLFWKKSRLFCKNTWLLLKEEIWQDVIDFTYLFDHVVDLVWSTLSVIRNSHCNKLQHTMTHCNTPNYTTYTSLIILLVKYAARSSSFMRRASIVLVSRPDALIVKSNVLHIHMYKYVYIYTWTYIFVCI